MLDRNRLTKLMGMATSDNDNEALVALRLANDLIKKERMTWDEVLAQNAPSLNIVLSRTGYKADEDWIAPHLKDKVMIDLMFRAVFAQPRTGNEDFWQWMDSIHNRWSAHGNLSQGQYNALKKCYQRATRTA